MTETAPGKAPWSELFSPGLVAKLGIVLLGVWINAADTLVTTTIMPSVAADIGGYEAFSWAVAGFLMGSVIASASAGRLAEIFGLGRASTVAGIVFALGCVGSALALDMNLFLAGRLVQGIGSGWFSGFAMVAIAQLFPRRQLARVFAIVSGVWGIATLLGPLLGGLLAESGQWRVVFWAFAVQAVLFAILAPRAFGNAEGKALSGRVPLVQLVLIALGIGVIGMADRLAQPAMQLAAIAGGMTLLGMTLWVDRHAPVPLLPRQASNPFSVIGAGYLAVFALTAASSPFSIYVPPILQQLRDLSPLEAGYVVGAMALAWTCAAFVVSNVRDGRERVPLVAGAALVCTGVSLQLWLVPQLHIAAIVGAGVVMGLGFGLCSALINRRAIIHLTTDEEAIGSAALMTVRQVGGAVGAALAGVAANVAGFGDGLSDASALATAQTVFIAGLPLALLGLLAALQMTRSPRFQN
ncbi:MFS transporter [Aurantiacibacter gilvus]|uniref:MFS transporter n=1 Tax=Aurantiacibacter gilvus TaxID=3139141 RepID=A0ABU9II48_9SPHN